ncbi:hypothetical protein VDG1235_2696 [Verrucomicrobiia bacterium DG1235]|nr:hypothetical protein VDG1235_2696 [Verrucomicrobiae bacterium DG1235]
MDDLLIVRSSDRVRPRLSQRRAQFPLGVNIGLVLGVAFGLIGATKLEQQPLVGMALGLAIGLALGGILGTLMKPRSKRRPAYPKDHYIGFPNSNEESEDSNKD